MKSYGIILFALVSNMVSAAPATDATFKQTSRDEILRRKVMRALAHERGPAPTYGTCVNSQPYSNDMGIYATFSDAAPSGEATTIIPIVPEPSTDACAEACNNTPGCVGAVFFLAECFMFSSSPSVLTNTTGQSTLYRNQDCATAVANYMGECGAGIACCNTYVAVPV